MSSGSRIPGSRAGPDRNPLIDVLRGVSILWVLLGHCPLVHVQSPLWESVLQVFYRHAYYGVVIFFVISGFMITRRSIERYGTLGRVSVRGFYLQRVARIAPLFLALIAILVAVDLARVPGLRVEPHWASLRTLLWYALTFRFNLFHIAYGEVNLGWDVLWSLSIEEVFYLCFPVACLVLRRTSLISWTLGLLMVAGVWHRASAGPQSAFSYLGCAQHLALGCAAALFCAHTRLRPGAGTACAALAASLALMLACGCVAPSPGDQASMPLFVGLGAAVFLVAAALRPGCGAALCGSAPLRLVGISGQASYEIYLYHSFSVWAAYSAFDWVSVEFPRNWPQTGAFTVGLQAVYLTLAVGSGWLLHRWIGAPSNRWIRSRWLGRPGMAQAQGGNR